MNLYLVVSETLYEKIPISDFGEGPLEPYSICELVPAKSREQARYLAWQRDRSYQNDMRECPNFRTRKLQDGFTGKGIVSDYNFYLGFWGHPKVGELFRSLEDF